MDSHRAIKDASLIVAAALPDEDSDVNSDTIDLGAGGFVPEEIEIEIGIPALADLEDDTSVTITLQDSADDETYANVDPLIQTSVTGADSAGSEAKTIRFRLPANIRRYVQFNQAVDDEAGTLTAFSVTYSLLF